MGMKEFEDYLESYLKEEMKRELEEELAKLPWWCPICGGGGNYEGERPDEYWLPPVDHICPELTPELKGVEEVRGLTPIFNVVDEPYCNVVRRLDELTEAHYDALVQIYELDKSDMRIKTMSPHSINVEDILHNIFYKE